MGVVYKVKEEVVSFIIDQKRSNPRLSCRKLVDLIQEKFETKVSKSSVNNVIKAHDLSAPVGRTPKKMSKEDNFKIPSTRKQELFKEAKRYIDVVKPSTEENPTVKEPVKTTDDQIREEEIRAKMEAKIAPVSPLTQKPPTENITRPTIIRQDTAEVKEKEEVIEKSIPAVQEVEKVIEEPSPEPTKKIKKLAWIDVNEQPTSETMTLRPDPVEEKVIAEPKEESKPQENNAEASTPEIADKKVEELKESKEENKVDEVEPIDELVEAGQDIAVNTSTSNNGLAYSNLGLMLFKCAQWDLMRQRPFMKTLEKQIPSRRENEYKALSDWLLAAPLFGYEDLLSLKGQGSEEERMINQYNSDIDLVDMVQQFSKLDDTFGFAMTLNTEMMMNLTQVKHIKITLGNGNIFYLDPRLSGAYASDKAINYGAPLPRAMEDIPDALVNNLRPMILRDIEAKALVPFMSFMYAQPNYYAQLIEVVGFTDEVLVHFNEPSQQARQFVASIRNDKKFELSESFDNEFYGIHGQCGQQMIKIGNFNLRQIQFQVEGHRDYITLVTNMDIAIDMKDVVIQWVMKYMAANGLKFQPINVTMPNLMDMSDTDKIMFDYTKEVTQAVFEYMLQAYFPDQKVTLEDFIEQYGKTSGVLRQDDERCDIFLKIDDKKSPLLHAMKLINVHQIYDYAGRAVHIFPQMS